MKAMILAAGLGTRLLPYTLKRPKPLFPILNIPILHLTISRLRKAGFTEIVVNAHHLRDQIKKALQREAGVILQEEESVLGTGGGLRRALPHFGPEPVLVVNGDIYHSIDYREVYRAHCTVRPDVSLVLQDFPRFNNVIIAEPDRVSGFNKSGYNIGRNEKILAFTGIHVINPEILHDISGDAASCIIDRYRDILQAGGTIRAHVATGHFWTDMGTPADYLQLHAGLLQREIPVYDELLPAVAKGPFVGPQQGSVAGDVKFLDWVCIGSHARIGAGATLQRAVVWDKAVVPAGADIKDTIVTP